jgi:hypothetical protein
MGITSYPEMDIGKNTIQIRAVIKLPANSDVSITFSHEDGHLNRFCAGSMVL